MSIGPIITWLVRRSLAHPGAWLFYLSCSALPVLISNLGPLGIGSTSGYSRPLFYEVAFIATLFGVISGATRLEDLDYLLRRLPVRRAFTIEAVTLALGSLGAATLVLVPVLTILPRTTTDPTAGWRMLFVAFHLTALMLLLRRTRMRSEVRSIVLVTLAWALPAIGNQGAGLIGNLKTLLGVTQDLELGATAVPWTVTVAPIIALVLLSVSQDLLRRSTP